MNGKVKYGTLHEYLEEQLQNVGCDTTLSLTRKFAKQHGLFFGELSQILEDFGGFCDCEVMLNVFARERIDSNAIIGDENFTTPRKYAIERGLYSNCLIDGRPVCWSVADAARKAGVAKVEFWVPCDEHDPFATPDTKRAMIELEDRKNP